MLNDRLRQILVVFVTVSLIVMNGLSNVRMFGPTTNADVSAKYTTLVTPAGYAFSIWGLIFLGLLGFAVYQALPSQRHNPRFRAAGPWYIINGIGNALWSPIFNQEWIGTALVVILLMFASLFMVMEGLRINPRTEAAMMRPVKAPETWLARVPFSVYFGWLTVATILNITLWLKATNFSLSGISETVWASGVLVLALVVGAVLYNRYRSVAYMLVFTWAYAAIAVKQATYPTLQIVAWAGAAVALLLAIWGLIAPRQQRAIV
ncbi:TspO/MBR family protein [Fibrella aquatilis]|uniref:Tryptophan-rich sensory protein n=1 Tax=Fibrella aquatilis TaxID=2817059 RepID=A0A939K2I9_9BACT|nr:TspO/MBR family protein [Fibrella aquatilis]MBO0933355.1 tryptophan-rich sensory protein [Fibrella aquatilis]